ncbi:MAG: hypothetical protein AB7F59_07460 [Bdellovibrionales bacterium]
MRILWVIAARSGSKSVLHKNIKSLGSLPLLLYRYYSTRQLFPQEDIWLSTDSLEYKTLAEKHGLHVPFLRSEALSNDTASSTDVLLHAAQHAVAQKKSYDGIGLLEPTSPFVKAEDLAQAVKKLFADPEASATVAVKEAKPSTFYIEPMKTYLTEIAKRIQTQGFKRRQDETIEVTPSGGFYISKWKPFLENKTYYTPKTIPYLLEGPATLEIDTPTDWQWAEFLVEKGYVSLDKLLGQKF